MAGWSSASLRPSCAEKAGPHRLVQSHAAGYAYGLMFEELSQKLNDTLQKLTGRGVLTEDAVREGLREIRRILLEADVSFDLTREFL